MQIMIVDLANWVLGAYSTLHAQAPCPISVLASAGVLSRGMQAQPIRFLQPTPRVAE